jgi:hypothetical protein
MTLNPLSAVLRVNRAFLPKTMTDVALNAEIEIQAFHPHPVDQMERVLGLNCPIRALHMYVQNTSLLRKSSCLFVSYRKGKRLGSGISKRILASWHSSVIRSAYVHLGRELPPLPKTSSHTLRELSSSWKELSKASVQDIVKAGTWTQLQTFARFYRLDFASQQAQVGDRMLQKVLTTRMHTS